MATSSNQYGATAAPPPTPSTQVSNLPSTSSDAADTLSRLFHLRLPSILSPPSRRNSPTTFTSIPTISSLSDPTITPSLLISAASKLGFFQLNNHSIPSQLAHSAHSDSKSLFRLPNHQKRLRFPPNWPLGYDCNDDEEEEGENGTTSSFCFDSSCSADSDESSLASLREFTREMEKVGFAVIEALSCAVGFENPIREDPTRVCSLMWISEDTTASGNKLLSPGKIYPYVVGLHYQVRCRKCTMLSDSGWVSVSPQVDSILVTLGDIAQVWSNGKLKKVRGRPVPTLAEEENFTSHSISMSLLLTLPLDSIVAPLLRTIVDGSSDEVEIREDEEYDHQNPNSVEEGRVFNSFSFEDYAWRVYHERVLLKDPLDRYRA